jgi:hypothetical protein
MLQSQHICHKSQSDTFVILFSGIPCDPLRRILIIGAKLSSKIGLTEYLANYCDLVQSIKRPFKALVLGSSPSALTIKHL